jgi:hypothetical protein
LHPIAKLTIDPLTLVLPKGVSQGLARIALGHEVQAVPLQATLQHMRLDEGKSRGTGIPRFHEISKISDLL